MQPGWLPALQERLDLTACLLAALREVQAGLFEASLVMQAGLSAALRVKARQFDCSALLAWQVKLGLPALLAWQLALWSGWREALQAMSDLQHLSEASLVMLQ